MQQNPGCVRISLDRLCILAATEVLFLQLGKKLNKVQPLAPSKVRAKEPPQNSLRSSPPLGHPFLKQRWPNRVFKAYLCSQRTISKPERTTGKLDILWL